MKTGEWSEPGAGPETLTQSTPFFCPLSSIFVFICVQLRSAAFICGLSFRSCPMLWLFRAARRLRALGILGMNRRNAACILDHNPRALYPVVDDKLRMRDLCELIGVPTPKVYAAVRYHSELRRLPEILGDHGDFVVKPNQ